MVIIVVIVTVVIVIAKLLRVPDGGFYPLRDTNSTISADAPQEGRTCTQAGRKIGWKRQPGMCRGRCGSEHMVVSTLFVTTANTETPNGASLGAVFLRGVRHNSKTPKSYRLAKTTSLYNFITCRT